MSSSQVDHRFSNSSSMLLFSSSTPKTAPALQGIKEDEDDAEDDDINLDDDDIIDITDGDEGLIETEDEQRFDGDDEQQIDADDEREVSRDDLLRAAQEATRQLNRVLEECDTIPDDILLSKHHNGYSQRGVQQGKALYSKPPSPSTASSTQVSMDSTDIPVLDSNQMLTEETPPRRLSTAMFDQRNTTDQDKVEALSARVNLLEQQLLILRREFDIHLQECSQNKNSNNKTCSCQTQSQPQSQSSLPSSNSSQTQSTPPSPSQSVSRSQNGPQTDQNNDILNVDIILINDVTNLNSLANQLCQKRHFAKAQQCLERAIQLQEALDDREAEDNDGREILSPNRIKLTNNLVHVLIEQGNLKGAENRLKEILIKAHQLTFDSHRHQNGFAHHHSRNGTPPAKQIKPIWMLAEEQQIIVFTERNLPNFPKEDIKIWQQVLEMNPCVATAIPNLAHIYRMQGKLWAAQVIEECLQRNDSSPAS